MIRYYVVCPKCGHKFTILKGMTIMELVSQKPLPKSRDEEEPDYCPKCNHKMSVLDPGFNDNVEKFALID
ncbi:MAG: hypothetical protein IKX60_04285 [Bacteroidales bacterium]|nr:hypothetical protein [Bacteroidales bacterium]